MNITERLSHAFHQNVDNRKHHNKKSISVEKLLSSFGLVGLELVAAGFLGACSPGVESPTGNNGVKGYYAWSANYCDRGPDFKQAAKDCQRQSGTWDKNECPDTQYMWYKTYVEEPSTCQVTWYAFPNQ